MQPPVGIEVHPRVLDIYRALAAPLHARPIRDYARKCRLGREADLARGCILNLADGFDRGSLAVSLRDFREFMHKSLAVKPSDQYQIFIRTGRPAGCPPNVPEAFHAAIAPCRCVITAADPDGVRRALVWLEDEMTARRAPLLPLGGFRRWPTIADRISRSPVAPYRWMTGWELEQKHDFYPEAYLNRLMHAGINGIWVAGLLRNLIASKTLPELGPPKHRLDVLKQLVAKAKNYGIRVFLFCIEPRQIPHDHPVFAAHPEIRGARLPGAANASLCTSAPLVRGYVREIMRELFTAAPDLAGLINIFCGERVTTCWTAHAVNLVQTCPRCRARSQVEVLAEDLNCFMEGIRSASPTAKLLAWTYSMDTARTKSGNAFRDSAASVNPVLDIMRKTAPDIIWLANFEHTGVKRICGRKAAIQEYSLSYIGPSPAFRKIAGYAHKSGRRCYAKTQIGTTYEISSVPYLPLPGIVRAKIEAMNRGGIAGIMASWIIGGEPSVMLKAAGEAAFRPRRTEPAFLERLAALSWAPEQAGMIAKAWKHFSDGFNLYPFALEVFYFGPITRAPAYKLHLEQETQLAKPYNFGIERNRAIQPFEDQVGRWTGPFTAAELVRSFRAMGRHWNKGLALMKKALAREKKGDEPRRQWAVARAAGIKFASAANVIEFYMLRDRLRKEKPRRPASGKKIAGRMLATVKDDLALAGEMKRVMRLHASIGFQSEIYDYSFSRELLNEKIEHDRRTLARLQTWTKSGVQFEILNRALPARPPDPDRQAAVNKLKAAGLIGD